MTHYSHEEWIQLADESVEEPKRRLMTDHGEKCDECRVMYENARWIVTALSDPMTWTTVDDLARPRWPAVEMLGELAARLDRERERARELLHDVLSSPAAFAQHRVEFDPRFRLPGVVDVLCSAAEELRQRQPQFAFSVAAAATRIATTLERDGLLWSPAMVGRAWMELGIALGVLTRYRQADEAFTKAQRAYDALGRDTTYESALLQLSRSIICSETERLSEARNLAKAAAVIFRDFGDCRRLVNALLIEGAVCHYGGEYSRAAAVYQEIVDAARTANDDLTIARALQNLGHTLVLQNKFDEAESCFVQALTLWDELAYPAERVRSLWAFGTLRIAQADFAGAIQFLQRASNELDTLGLLNDAALVRLELAEALLLTGQYAEARPILEAVVVSFTSEQMLKSASIALAYLRETIAAGGLEISVVRHVRSYLERLPTEPSARFAPLSPR